MDVVAVATYLFHDAPSLLEFDARLTIKEGYVMAGHDPSNRLFLAG